MNEDQVNINIELVWVEVILHVIKMIIV